MDDNDRTVGKFLYYARRAGYLEGALWVIAKGSAGIDPRVAAARALEAVGEDHFRDDIPRKRSRSFESLVRSLELVEEDLPADGSTSRPNG